jgi:hypothetical protein
MQAAKVSLHCWRTEMRYCPYCRRFNEGNPQICHFCGRTWYIKLCPRGHENPFNAQYCGTCGSADLSDTAGSRSVILVVIKLIISATIGFFLLSLVAALFQPTSIRYFLSLVIVSYILYFILTYLLPKSMTQFIKKIFRSMIVKMFSKLGDLFKWIWNI